MATWAAQPSATEGRYRWVVPLAGAPPGDKQMGASKN